MSRPRARPKPSEAPTQPGGPHAEPSLLTMPGTQVRARTLSRRRLAGAGLGLGLVILIAFGLWETKRTGSVPSATPRPPTLAPESMEGPGDPKTVPAPPDPPAPSRPEAPSPAVEAHGADVAGRRSSRPALSSGGSSATAPTRTPPGGGPLARAARDAVGRAQAAPDDPERFEAALDALRAWSTSLPSETGRKVEAATRRAEFSWSVDDLERALQSAAATRP